MTLNSDSTLVISEPMVRSRIYKLFALGFKYPTREAFDRLLNGQFVSELLELISTLPHLADIAREESGLTDKIEEDLMGIVYEDFETIYVGTFDIGFPEPPCPPYEGFYSQAKPKTEVMLEVGGFYTHFGLAMNQEEGKRELPDYLCAELEFLHFLAFKEAQARERGNQEFASGYLLAQKDFLERHITGWLPEFSVKVQGVEGLVFYPDLARVLVRFVSEEFVLLRAAVP